MLYRAHLPRLDGGLFLTDGGISPSTKLTAADARDRHAVQIGTFAGTAADMVTAITMTYADEAVGIAAELDEAIELDAGDPADLGRRYAALRRNLPRLTVLGGCCGTDHRHVGEIRDSWLGSDAG